MHDCLAYNCRPVLQVYTFKLRNNNSISLLYATPCAYTPEAIKLANLTKINNQSCFNSQTCQSIEVRVSRIPKNYFSPMQ